MNLKSLTKNSTHRRGNSIVSFIALCFCVGTVAAGAFTLVPARSAQAIAFVPTQDSFNLVQNSITAANTTLDVEKEFWLDAFFNQAAKIVIHNITDSIVSWINSGFRGSPAFVTDPQAFFTDVADQVAGEFIAGTELGFICDPFQIDIRAALNYNYSSDFRVNCRLSDAVRNTEDFLRFTGGDFNQGGWAGWFSMTQQHQNNPYGAYAQARGELSLRIATAQGVEEKKLDWGKGFLSWQDCIQEDQQGNCTLKGPIKTPGSVIESQLENVLGSGIRQLELADEFNEIVGALVGQLVQRVLITGLSTVQDLGSDTGSGSGSRIFGYCYPNKRQVLVGESVTWTARGYINGGQATGFAWAGSPPLAATPLLAGSGTSTVTVQYSTAGEKNARVQMSGGGQSETFDCGGGVLVE